MAFGLSKESIGFLRLKLGTKVIACAAVLIAVNTSLGGQKVIGLSYLDSTMAKSNTFVPLCRIHYLNLSGTQVCISAIQDIVNLDANNITTFISGPCAID